MSLQIIRALVADYPVESKFSWVDPMHGQNLTAYDFTIGNVTIRMALSSYDGFNIPSVQEQRLNYNGKGK